MISVKLFCNSDCRLWNSLFWQNRHWKCK